MASLPSDIVFEILTRASLKTIDTCMLVNKEWHDMVYESSFMPQFCKKSQNISGYFVQSLAYCKHVTEFVSMNGCSEKSPFHLPVKAMNPKVKIFDSDFDMKIEASSKQGLLCCVKRTYRESRYHVCKPSTKQWIKLPNPKMRFSTIKVALIVLRSNPLHFKIIRLSSPKTLYDRYSKLGYKHCRCEIFDSEAWAWGEAKDVIIPEQVSFDKFTPAVHAGGLVYFKLSDNTMIALNYYGEKAIPRISLPNHTLDEHDEYYRYNQLLEYNGKLGFTCLSPKGIQLWCFETGKLVWKLRKEVDMETLENVTRSPSPVGFYNADIALMKDFYKVIFYKLQDKSFDVVKLDKCATIQEIFPFRSDLEPLDLRMPEANKIVSPTKYHSILSSLLVICFIVLFVLIFVSSYMRKLF